VIRRDHTKQEFGNYYKIESGKGNEWNGMLSLKHNHDLTGLLHQGNIFFNQMDHVYQNGKVI
jgi:hypothetical protein